MACAYERKYLLSQSCCSLSLRNLIAAPSTICPSGLTLQSSIATAPQHQALTWCPHPRSCTVDEGALPGASVGSIHTRTQRRRARKLHKCIVPPYQSYQCSVYSLVEPIVFTLYPFFPTRTSPIPLYIMQVYQSYISHQRWNDMVELYGS